MWLIPILLIGLALYASGRERDRGTYGPTPTKALPPPNGAASPSPSTVLGQFARLGQTPPPFVILCAIAEAEENGRGDIADDIVRTYVEPAVKARDKRNGIVDFVDQTGLPPDAVARMQEQAGLPEAAARSAWAGNGAEQRFYPPSFKRDVARGRGESVNAATEVRLSDQQRDAVFQGFAQRLANSSLPPAEKRQILDSLAETLLSKREVDAIDGLAYGLAKAFNTPINDLKAEADAYRAAHPQAAPQPAPPRPSPSSDPVSPVDPIQAMVDAEGARAAAAYGGSTANGNITNGVSNGQSPVTISGEISMSSRSSSPMGVMEAMMPTPPMYRSPIGGIDDKAWDEFCGRLVRETPSFQSARHVGQFRQRRERLAELGIDPNSIVGSPDHQRGALDADLTDAYRQAADPASGLVRNNVHHAILVPQLEAPVMVSLSGLLGVIQAAGLEGAEQWFAHQRDRKRFPHTTQAFLRTNGVF